MSKTTFILAKDRNIYRRTGGISGNNDHVVQDRSGFTTEMADIHVVLKYEFDHNKYAGVITNWAEAEDHIKGIFPEYFV